MPIEPSAQIEITAFDWVPDFARGLVRDMRPRWACEELGLPYRERIISTVERPEWFYLEQPWGQVPVLRDGALHIFESGAILLHLGEKDPALLPREPQARLDVLSWLFAALNSIEPMLQQVAILDLFHPDVQWAKAARPAAVEFAEKRLGGLATALGEKDWLTGAFTIADIMMVTVLRNVRHTDIVAGFPNLAAYQKRGEERPAFQRALADQLAVFDRNPAPARAAAD